MFFFCAEADEKRYLIIALKNCLWLFFNLGSKSRKGNILRVLLVYLGEGVSFKNILQDFSRALKDQVFSSRTPQDNTFDFRRLKEKLQK